MNLQRKTLLIIVLTVTCSFLVLYTVANWILVRGFQDIETEAARQKVEEGQIVLSELVNKVDAVLADYAAWDDSYHFVENGDEQFIKSTLPVGTFVNAGINAIVYLNQQGRIVFQRQVDREREEEVPFSTALALNLIPGSRLINHDSTRSVIKGVLSLPEGTMLVVSRPIVKSDMSGPINGTLFMGRYLDRERIEDMARILQRKPIVHKADEPNLPREWAAARANLTQGHEFSIQTTSEDSLACYGLIKDIFGEPALIMRLDLPRDIYRQGRLTIRTLVWCLLAGGVLLGVVILRLLNTKVLSRVAALDRAARSIARNNDTSQRVPAHGRDELANLATSFNAMLQALETSSQDLRTAKEAAEEASRLKSKFLAIASHEIRSPLHSIISFAETILASNRIEDTCHHTETILQEAQTMLAIINGLLDNAKIEAGKMELEYSPMDLRKLLTGVINNASVQAKNKPVEIRAAISDQLPHCVLGDSLRLRQILLNLTSNAVKFTDQGSVTVSADPVTGESGRITIRFAVSDTGIGIPKDKQETIFKSFSQASSSTSRQYGGTGLGTTIARQLVTLMGGQIGLESEPERGSTFWFTVPFELSSTAPDLADSVAVDSQETNAQAPAVARGGRILVVDDYPANREAASLHLKSAGYAVTLANSGEQALAACQDGVFDLILLDVNMPGLTGYQTASRIRSDQSPSAEVPIVAMTGESDAATSDTCLQAGMNDILVKPVRRNVLLTTVARWLQVIHPNPETPDPAGSAPVPIQNAADSDPLDYDLAIKEFGGRPLLDNVISRFLGNVESQIETMREALTENEPETLRRESHAIKGGASTLTASPLAEIAARMENLSKSCELDEVAPALDELVAEFDRLKQYVHQHSE
jgi:signal transduction histidine kinase/CheY-like chemotaxis protein/HPt (histidine-containing phosphotransfer) domain-containing protein